MENKKHTKFSEEWIIRSFSSEIPVADKKALIEWLESDPANFAGYQQLKKIWDQSARVLADNPEKFEKSWQRFLGTIHGQPKIVSRRRFFLLRIAASVALLAGLAATLLWLMPSKTADPVVIAERQPDKSYIITAEGKKLFLPDNQTELRYDSLAAALRGDGHQSAQTPAEPQMLELVVPQSRRITLVLSDGSKIWLNSESRLRYPEYFTGPARQVTLEGEAFFDVARTDGKSFIVSTREISITVLGTTFNVSAYSGDPQISTTLVEGSVEVRKNGTAASRLLKPSERAVWSVENNSFSIDSTDTELYTSWINGYLKFSSESLEEVVRKLVRSYGIPMIIADPALREYKFSGKLGLQDTVTQVLNVIRLAANLNFHEENGTIIIQNNKE